MNITSALNSLTPPGATEYGSRTNTSFRKQGAQRYAYRPDFVLELIDESRLDKRFPKLILDAKFRTVFKASDCRQLLD